MPLFPGKTALANLESGAMMVILLKKTGTLFRPYGLENILLKRTLPALLCLLALPAFCHGQAKYTASRAGDLQLGGGFTSADSDYTTNRLRGFAFYGDFDLNTHYGVEVDFHQANDPNSDIYERSYEVGGRYFRTYGNIRPYVKALYGRGVFNFPYNEANLGYNMFVGGGGVDIAVTRHINVRGDFEYQRWLTGTGLSNGLSPTLFTVGVAYHFSAGHPR